jgi:hypothetical protein
MVKDLKGIIAKHKAALVSFGYMYRTGAITDTQVVVHRLENILTQICE